MREIKTVAGELYGYFIKRMSVLRTNVGSKPKPIPVMIVSISTWKYTHTKVHVNLDHPLVLS